MNERYLERAAVMLNAALIKTDGHFRENFPRLSAEFAENFKKICGETAGLQESGNLGDIAYIEYTMLRTNLINKDYAAEVRVYGGDWYLDKEQRALGRFDISSLFKYFDGLWTELYKLQVSYTGKISALDTAGFMMDAAAKFYSYVITLCRFSVLDCIEQDYFKKIKKSPQFEINAGEYMARTQSVYKENAEKDRES
jgi:hypothetical protein